MTLPDFLIIGEQKCGTTTLWQLLRRHPRIFFPEEKELHFFSSYERFAPCGRARRGDIDRYEAQFAAAAPGATCGEATPNYLSDLEAPRWIHEYVPDVKLIVILRNPVERAISHYFHQIRRGDEKLSLDEAILREPERIDVHDPGERERFSYVTRGRYIEGLQRYEQVFGRDRLCVEFLSELRADRVSVMKRLYQHVGLEAELDLIEGDLPHQNRASYPRWAAADRAKRRGMELIERLGPRAALAAKQLGRATRGWREQTGAPPVPASTRLRLAREFEESDRALSRWLGRPLPWTAEIGAA